MNKTTAEGLAYTDGLTDIIPKFPEYQFFICPPYVQLWKQRELIDSKKSTLMLGAQNVHYEDNGQFTGEISPVMLKEIGLDLLEIGHSERRQYHGEDDMLVNAKAKALLAKGIAPIICVGESLEQREMDLTMEYVAYQVKAALSGIDATQLRRCIIAYEPIWAIGTGKTATAEQAQEVCEGIRAVIRKIYGARPARAVSILYGGSMNAKNAAELLAQPDIDGGLIGGASLKPVDFATIIAATAQG